MKPVRYDDDADEELIDEIARYELRRDGLGTEFLTAVREAVRLIAQNPDQWQTPPRRILTLRAEASASSDMMACHEFQAARVVGAG